MACRNDNENHNCSPKPCRLDNAIKQYKKTRNWFEDPSLKYWDVIIDELRKEIRCASISSSYAISSSHSLISDLAISASRAELSYWAISASWSRTSSRTVEGNVTHNLLDGLQGGIFPNQYYHISQKQFDDLVELTSGNFTELHKHESSSYALTASYALNAGVGGTSLITGSTYPITSSWAVNMAFNGDRAITRNDPNFQGINVGGTNVVQFLNNFFFPFIPATVALSLVPSTTVYEIGNDPSPVIRVNVTANDETLFESGSVRKDGVNTWTITKPVLPSTNYDNTDSNITTGHYYQAYVSASNNGSPGLISSNMSTIYFVYPYFWGTTSTAGLSGTALYTGLTKTIQREDTNQTISFSGTAVYIYYCFPDGQGYSDVSAIYDPNNFEVKSLFTKTIESVTSTGLTSNWTQNYVVYRLTLLSNPNGNYRFVH